ncbi:Cellulose binding domain-containing protein [Modicisalibacter ilicicola DSM 19980]|uniref:Cellulose binding domain-containing protein n=1 Tax=Modicisalibacter ilicicola DSM 19980 TaxID=1121942 RepID=A0A1M4U7A8_9GAMM|nr:cellulose binding domain-containing protein [Halomonas ilicicola]SHE52652.1 Cellulose binding domain-containing protein [Halomonas ilicicola DSM 19980]
MSSLIDYTLTSQWNGGFVLELFVTNSSLYTFYDYQIAFAVDGVIADIWNASVVSRTASGYVVADDDDKNDLAPGETVRFKFKVLSESGELPFAFTVNGEHAELTPEAEALRQAQMPEKALLGDDYPIVDNAITVGPEIDADILNALILLAPENATIHLAAGDYHFDDAIRITRSDVSLIGAGADNTHVTFSEQALIENPAHGFIAEGTGATPAGYLRADVDEHGKVLTLGEGHGLAVGDTIRLWQDNTAEYLDAIGDTAWRNMDVPLRTSMARVAGVEGDSITLDRGVHFDFDAGATRVERLDVLENVTLGGFSIDFPLGIPDSGDFSNHLPALDSYHAVEFSGTVASHLFDIQVVNTPSLAFEIARSLDVTAERLVAQGAFNKGGGGNGYAYELRESFDGTFTDLSDSGMRHSLVFASWHSSVGNTVNIDYTDRDINFHGGRDHRNSVHVEQSIRDAATDVKSPTLWINSGGEFFGAPTDAEANEVRFDYVVGSRRDDTVQGTDSGVYLDGAEGHDSLYGGAGNDLLRGGAGWGNDLIDGGDGFDTVLFDQAFFDSRIRYHDDGSLSVEGAGHDTLIDVERAIFSDGITLDIATRVAVQGEPLEFPAAEEVELDPRSAFAELVDIPVPRCTASLEVVSRWSSGYVMAVEITNHLDDTLEHPLVEFTLAADITRFYGAALVERRGDLYRVALDDSAEVTPEATQRFSFKAYAPESLLPEGLTLGGQDVDVDHSSLHAGSAPEAGSLISVESNVVNAWQGGHIAEVLVKNVSEERIDDLVIAFDLPSRIDTLWNAEGQHDDGRYTLSDDGDTPPSLAPGETWRFSYKTYHDEPTLPDNIVADGSVVEATVMPGSDILLQTKPDDDLLLGGDNDENLYGLSGDDRLHGRGGDDYLAGGLGADALEGGAGADVFAFATTFDSNPPAADTLLDFSSSQGDLIDLAAIDADLGVAGNQAFAWRHALGFSGNAGELRFSDGRLAGDVNGDGIADLAIQLAGVETLQINDFLL